jgi:5'-deoxynucleotidase YfbR-like HD superfamily hydrolase
MSSLDSDIFGDKKLKDLFQEIYNNQKKKEKQISSLIDELKPMIESIGDATLVVPLLKEYLEIGVKNDEQLIKMATIIQRCLTTSNSSGTGGDGFTISDAEKEQLLNDINKLNETK